MITQPSNPKPAKIKKARLLGDWSILHGFTTSKFWKYFFFRPREAWWMLFTQYLQAHTALLAYGLTSILRIKHGSLAGGGIIQTLALTSILLAYNSVYVWKIFASIVGWFILPALPFFKTTNELYQLAFIAIESEGLIIYGAVFIIASLAHATANWLGYSNKSVSSRGVGYSYLLINRLLGKHLHINEFVIYFLEAILVASVGGYLLAEQIDPYFGGWLIAISFGEIRILLFERSMHMQHRRLLDI